MARKWTFLLALLWAERVSAPLFFVLVFLVPPVLHLGVVRRGVRSSAQRQADLVWAVPAVLALSGFRLSATVRGRLKETYTRSNLVRRQRVRRYVQVFTFPQLSCTCTCSSGVPGTESSNREGRSELMSAQRVRCGNSSR